MYKSQNIMRFKSIIKIILPLFILNCDDYKIEKEAVFYINQAVYFYNRIKKEKNLEYLLERNTVNNLLDFSDLMEENDAYYDSLTHGNSAIHIICIATDTSRNRIIDLNEGIYIFDKLVEEYVKLNL